MLNGILVFIFVAAVLLGALGGGMQAVTDALLESVTGAVTLALRLIGVMAFFLGLMRVAADGGLLRIIARVVSPVMRLLFPSVPPDHPAMSAMILNLGSNMMGLTNAATPFGIKAMEELNTLNRERGTATNSMVVFLAINTSAVALFPTGVIGLRAAAGSQDATGIIVPTWFASIAATLVGVVMAKTLQRLPRFRATAPEERPSETAERKSAERLASEVTAGAASARPVAWRGLASLAVLVALGVAFGYRLWALTRQGTLIDAFRTELSFWILPLFVTAVVLFGWWRSVPVYESMVEGAKEGFQVAVRIIPYLVVILGAVGILRASGGIGLLKSWLGPVTALIGMPAEALPMALVRPLSGSAAMGVMTEIMEAHGPDSFLGYLVGTMSGSTDTTFYILAVYFGAVGVKRTRHALAACLAADLAGILAAVLIVNLIFGTVTR